MEPIYLDYNATTPVDPAVADAMAPYIAEHFGNPSSGHVFGARARSAVERARAQVAELLGCGPDEVVFTSGGSESNNHAIKGAASALRHRGNHIITSTIEHPAVAEVCRYLESIGNEVTYLPVDGDGLVDPEQVAAAIRPETILISVMHANNEVGTIEPIADICAAARSHQVVTHSDCAQSVGKIPVRVDDLGVDLLSIAGHKVYAPKGIGALYVRHGIDLDKLVHGADHERNRRAGTENVVQIVGLGHACEMVTERLDEYGQHLGRMRDRLEQGLLDRLQGLRVNGRAAPRLPNTSSVSFRGVQADALLAAMPAVAASSGAACHSDGVTVSSVLTAMHVPPEFAAGTVRFSVGRGTSEDEVDRALSAVVAAVQKLRSAAPS